MWYTFTQLNVTQLHKKKEILSFVNMCETEGHHAKKIKLDTERQILYGVTYMWTLKK